MPIKGACGEKERAHISSECRGIRKFVELIEYSWYRLSKQIPFLQVSFDFDRSSRVSLVDKAKLFFIFVHKNCNL